MRWPHIVGAAIIVLGAAGSLFHLWRIDRAKERFEARVQRLRDAGEPTELADLVRPSVPLERNANHWLRQAHAWYEANDPTDARHDVWWYPDGPIDAADLPKVRAYLKTVGPYVALLERAVACEDARAVLDPSSNPVEVEIPDLPLLQESAFMLRALACDDPAGAPRYGRIQFELGRRVDLPFLIGRLVLMTASGTTVEILKRAAGAPAFDARAFRTAVDPCVARALRDRGPDPQALREERLIHIWLGRHPERIDEFYEDKFTRLDPVPFSVMLHEELDALDEAIAACGRTPEDALAFSGGHLPTKWFHAYARHTATLRLLRVAMRLLEYEQANGAWPGTLAHLGELPQDPFTRGPFAYEHTKTGVTLFVDDPRAKDWDWLRYEFE